MNIEKVILLAMMGLVASGVFVTRRLPPPREYDPLRTSPEVTITKDFDLESVLDNTPFDQYYQTGRRNPFVPVEYTKPAKPDAALNPIKRITKDFRFPWQRPKETPKTDPKPKPKDTAPPRRDVPIAALPAKPESEAPPEQLDKKAQQESKTIPVYLIGFAKTYTDKDADRKALLANKSTGEIYTVKKGDAPSGLGLTITDVTPYSVIIFMQDGRRVEFLNDVLKEAN
jgi:hypothetical protein